MHHPPAGTNCDSDLLGGQFKGVHLAAKGVIPVILDLLKVKGLPIELALQVMSMADYGPVWRPYIRDDPLYSTDADELKKYLSYCRSCLLESTC